MAADQGAAADGDPARRVRLHGLGATGAARLRRCGRGRCGRRSGRAIGRGRWCSSTGRRCRPGRRSAGVSGGSTRWLRRCRTRARRRRSSRFDMTLESFLEGHVRAFEWLGGVPRECVYDNLRVGRRPPRRATGDASGIAVSCTCAATTASTRQRARRRRRARRARSRRAVRYLKTGFWPARRFASCTSSTGSTPTGATGSATGARTRPAASPSPSGWPRSGRRCGRCRRTRFDWSRAPVGAGADRRLPAPRRLLLPRAGAARARAGRAALRPRPGLDLPPRRTRSPATRAATSRASGCRRRSCAPSRRRRAAARRCRGSRSRRPSSPTTRSCAHEPRRRPASGCPTCSRS